MGKRWEKLRKIDAETDSECNSISFLRTMLTGRDDHVISEIMLRRNLKHSP